MNNEDELRLHRVCFTGQRPEKLSQPEWQVKAWLRKEIEKAIADGYTTFITGMAMGVDIWAGQIVADIKSRNPQIHLIAAVPWLGVSKRWGESWRELYEGLLAQVDLKKVICTSYSDDVFMQRNRWMVDHSNLVIAYYNGSEGGAQKTLEYAEERGIRTVIGGVEAIGNLSG